MERLRSTLRRWRERRREREILRLRKKDRARETLKDYKKPTGHKWHN
jgi:hypothetical protein